MKENQSKHTPEPMTAKDCRERERLHKKWATGRASMREMKRCMELDRKAEACNKCAAGYKVHKDFPGHMGRMGRCQEKQQGRGKATKHSGHAAVSMCESLAPQHPRALAALKGGEGK